MKKYGLIKGSKFNGTLVGAGGEINSTHVCNTFVHLKDKTISQFLLTDIENKCGFLNKYKENKADLIDLLNSLDVSNSAQNVIADKIKAIINKL